MPADHRSRLDQHQVSAPVPNELVDEYPEEAIPGTQPGTATGSGQHGQLVPREEILDNQITTISESGAREAQQQTRYFKHISESASGSSVRTFAARQLAVLSGIASADAAVVLRLVATHAARIIAKLPLCFARSYRLVIEPPRP